MKVDYLINSFLAGNLPKEHWTHEAHLKVGLWHLLSHNPEEALLLLRTRITALNEFHGIINSDTNGYHETLTTFYVQVISAYLANANVADPIELLAEGLISLFGSRGLPLKYYSREVLFSKKARREFVSPDLQKFDFQDLVIL